MASREDDEATRHVREIRPGGSGAGNQGNAGTTRIAQPGKKPPEAGSQGPTIIHGGNEGHTVIHRREPPPLEGAQGGKTYALLRLDMGEGVDYVKYFVSPSRTVEDWYIYTSAALFSASARFNLATMLKNDSLLYSLFGMRSVKDGDVKPFTALRNHLVAGDFAAAYRAELKTFGVDFVVAAAGNMRTGGPAKTAAALARVADGMTAPQRELYGKAFDTFATKLNSMQSSGLDAASAAKRVIELAEQVPAPSRAPVGADADEMLRAAREKSDVASKCNFDIRVKSTGQRHPTPGNRETGYEQHHRDCATDGQSSEDDE